MPTSISVIEPLPIHPVSYDPLLNIAQLRKILMLPASSIPESLENKIKDLYEGVLPIYYEKANANPEDEVIRLNEYLSSEQFNDLKIQFEQCAQPLLVFLKEQLIEVKVDAINERGEPIVTKEPAGNLLNKFLDRLLNKDEFSDYRIALFGEGKKNLEIISVFIQDPEIDLNYKKENMMLLFEDAGLGACAAGCFTRLQRVAENLKNKHNLSLNTLIQAFVKSKIEEITSNTHLSYTQKNLKAYIAGLMSNENVVGNEIHAFNYLQYRFKYHFGLQFLTVPQDIYVDAFINSIHREQEQRIAEYRAEIAPLGELTFDQLEMYRKKYYSKKKCLYDALSEFFLNFQHSFTLTNLVTYISNELQSGITKDLSFSETREFIQDFFLSLVNKNVELDEDNLFSDWLEKDAEQEKKISELTLKLIIIDVLADEQIHIKNLHQGIYPKNLALSYLEINGKKNYILNLLEQQSSKQLAQLLALPTESLKDLINKLVETQDDLIYFLKALLKKTSIDKANLELEKLKTALKESPQLFDSILYPNQADTTQQLKSQLFFVKELTKIDGAQANYFSIKEIVAKYKSLLSTVLIESILHNTIDLQTFFITHRTLNLYVEVGPNDLSSMIFYETNLKERNLFWSYLYGINFSKKDLSNAQFNEPIAKNGFKESNLKNAFFAQISIINSYDRPYYLVNFQEADLRDATFEKVKIKVATDINFSGAIFSTNSLNSLINAHKDIQSNYYGADLSHVDFTNEALKALINSQQNPINFSKAIFSTESFHSFLNNILLSNVVTIQLDLRSINFEEPALFSIISRLSKSEFDKVVKGIYSSASLASLFRIFEGKALSLSAADLSYVNFSEQPLNKILQARTEAIQLINPILSTESLYSGLTVEASIKLNIIRPYLGNINFKDPFLFNVLDNFELPLLNQVLSGIHTTNSFISMLIAFPDKFLSIKDIDLSLVKFQNEDLKVILAARIHHINLIQPIFSTASFFFYLSGLTSLKIGIEQPYLGRINFQDPALLRLLNAVFESQPTKLLSGIYDTRSFASMLAAFKDKPLVLENIDLSLVNFQDSEIKRLLIERNASLSFANNNLSGIRFDHLVFNGFIDFSSSIFEKVSFYNVKFNTGVSFFKSVLSDINFSSTLLSVANFRQSKLKKIQFMEARLLQAWFHGANFENINFKNSLLENINFVDTHDDQLSGIITVLHNVIFDEATLIKCQIKHVDLNGGSFVSSKLLNSDITESVWEDVTLTKATLREVCVENCIFEHINFSEANLKEVYFEEVLLNYIDFKQAYLSQSSFISSIFKNCQFDRVLFNKVELNQGEIFETKFEGSNFNELDFLDIHLTSTQFHSVRGELLNFMKCKLDNISFLKLTLESMIIDSSGLNKVTFISSDLKNHIIKDLNHFKSITLQDSIINLAHFSYFIEKEHRDFSQVKLEPSTLDDLLSLEQLAQTKLPSLSLANTILSAQIFEYLISRMKHKNFQFVDLSHVPSLVLNKYLTQADYLFDSAVLPENMVIEEVEENVIRKRPLENENDQESLGEPARKKPDLESLDSSKKMYKTFKKFLQKNQYQQENIELQAFNQFTLLNSDAFKANNLNAKGLCEILTYGLSESLLTKNPLVYFESLQTLQSLEARVIARKNLSQRENDERRAFIQHLYALKENKADVSTWQAQTESKPQRLRIFKQSLRALNDDFAIHIELPSFSSKPGHLVALFRLNDHYTYFDSNAVYIKGIKKFSTLWRLFHKSLNFYTKSFRHPKLITRLLYPKTSIPSLNRMGFELALQSERQRLYQQDQSYPPLHLTVDISPISRVKLYDLGLSYHADGNLNLPGQLLEASMQLNQQKLTDYLQKSCLSFNEKDYIYEFSRQQNNELTLAQQLLSKIPLYKSSLLPTQALHWSKNAISGRRIPLIMNDWDHYQHYLETSALNTAITGTVSPHSVLASKPSADANVRTHLTWRNSMKSGLSIFLLTKSSADILRSLINENALDFSLGVSALSYMPVTNTLESRFIKLGKGLSKSKKLLLNTITLPILEPFEIIDFARALAELDKLKEQGLDPKIYRDIIANITFSSADLGVSGALWIFRASTSGGLVTALVLLGAEGTYNGISLLISYSGLHLSADQKARTFFHGMVGMDAPLDVQTIKARQKWIDELATLQNQQLQQLPSEVVGVVFALGDTYLNSYKRVVGSEKVCFSHGMATRFALKEYCDVVPKYEKGYEPSISASRSEIRMDQVYKNITATYLEGKELPADPCLFISIPHLQCSAQQKIFDTPDQTIAGTYLACSPSPLAPHLCENALLLIDRARFKNSTVMSKQPHILLDLKRMNSGSVYASTHFKNHFLINEQGNAKVQGGLGTTNQFDLLNDMFIGHLIGGESTPEKKANNILHLNGLEQAILLFQDNKLHYLAANNDEAMYSASLMALSNGSPSSALFKTTIVTKNINYYVSSTANIDLVDCNSRSSTNTTASSLFVDTGGGPSQATPDYLYYCSRGVLSGYTQLVAQSNASAFSINADKPGFINIVQDAAATDQGLITLFFSDSELLEANSMTYDFNHNSLLLKLRTNTFVELESYWNKQQAQSAYQLYNQHEQLILPQIQHVSSIPNNDTVMPQVINHFLRHLNASDQQTVEQLHDYYQSSPNLFVSIENIIKSDAGWLLINSGDATELLLLRADVSFAAAGAGEDIYQFPSALERSNNSTMLMTLNNYDKNRDLDLILVPDVAGEKIDCQQQQRDLWLQTDYFQLVLQSYFSSKDYQHLIVVDTHKKLWIPFFSNNTNVRLIPYYKKQPSQPIFIIDADLVEQQPWIALETKLEKLHYIRSDEDLLLCEVAKNKHLTFCLTLKNYYKATTLIWNTLILFEANQGCINHYEGTIKKNLTGIEIEQYAKFVVNRNQMYKKTLLNKTHTISFTDLPKEIDWYASEWESKSLLQIVDIYGLIHIGIQVPVNESLLILNFEKKDAAQNLIYKQLTITHWNETASPLKKIIFDPLVLDMSSFETNQVEVLEHQFNKQLFRINIKLLQQSLLDDTQSDVLKFWLLLQISPEKKLSKNFQQGFDFDQAQSLAFFSQKMREKYSDKEILEEIQGIFNEPALGLQAVQFIYLQLAKACTLDFSFVELRKCWPLFAKKEIKKIFHVLDDTKLKLSKPMDWLQIVNRVIEHKQLWFYQKIKQKLDHWQTSDPLDFSDDSLGVKKPPENHLLRRKRALPDHTPSAKVRQDTTKSNNFFQALINNQQTTTALPPFTYPTLESYTENANKTFSSEQFMPKKMGIGSSIKDKNIEVQYNANESNNFFFLKWLLSMFGKQSMVNRMNTMEHTLNQPQPIETNQLDYSEKLFKMALDKYGSNDDSMAKETLVQIEKNRATKKSTASAEKTPHHKNWFNFFTGFFPHKQSVANNPMPFLSLP